MQWGLNTLTVPVFFTITQPAIFSDQSVTTHGTSYDVVCTISLLPCYAYDTLNIRKLSMCMESAYESISS